MAAEGKNKVASSLLDLQPTAVLELFKVFPDRITKPTLFVGFHGGSIFDKSITWQGVQYLPLAMESEGFDILGDGKLSRPKIRVANQGNVITNFLQNYKDLINAQIIRKRVSVKFLDDVNFDGGNPFGVADPTAELTEEKWLMGRKVQESKVFVEFELNSPLDLENFTVNSRGVVAKFCYWQYRGEGCRYEGIPIERDDGSPFLDPDGSGVAPVWPSSYSDPDAPIDFWADPDAEWNGLRNYVKGDIAVMHSPSFEVPSQTSNIGSPLKTAYVCVSDNVGQLPQGNPTYWQKDGCTKKFPACQKRFNKFDLVSYQQGQNIESGFNAVKISGADNASNEWWTPQSTGYFFSDDITGYLTGEFTLVGWANTNINSAYGAGILSTSRRSDGVWPDCRFINIGVDVNLNWDSPESTPNNAGQQINAYHMGYLMSPTSYEGVDNSYRVKFLNYLQSFGDQKEWNQYVTRHSTGWDGQAPSDEPISERDTKLDIFVNLELMDRAGIGEHGMEHNVSEEAGNIAGGLGNFASIAERTSAGFTRDDLSAAPVNNGLPEYFRVGAADHYYGIKGYVDGSLNVEMQTASINGALGPWALWNRALNNDELEYLYKSVAPAIGGLEEGEKSFGFVPRSYGECTGHFTTLTGGTGDGLWDGVSPDGTPPILYAQNSLVAWWDGTTGRWGALDPTDPDGLLDIHTGGYHLTGSGDFEGFEETYTAGPTYILDNPTSPYPRFGGYPGTDGFSYGRNAQM